MLRSQSAGQAGPLTHPPAPRIQAGAGLTSRIRFFWGSFTLPARQQCDKALWMINLLDLALGSLYSRGPRQQSVSRDGTGREPAAAHIIQSLTYLCTQALMLAKKHCFHSPSHALDCQAGGLET